MTDSAVLDSDVVVAAEADNASWLSELNELYADTEQWISNTLQRLGWTEEHLLNDSPTLVTCPVDSSHRMPEASLQRHTYYCKLYKEQGYSRSELDEDQSSKFFYEKAPSVVTVELDDAKLRHILSQTSNGASWNGPNPRSLPRTVARSMTEFSVEERLHIYDSCIAEVHARDKPVTIPAEQLSLLAEDSKNDADDKSADPNSIEFLTKARDAKRKRQSYRAKNVHITRKSHTEIIRDVLANQMTLLQQIWEAEAKEKQEQSRMKHSDGNAALPSTDDTNGQEERRRAESDNESDSRSRHKKRKRSEKKSSRHHKHTYRHKHKKRRHGDRTSKSPSSSSRRGERTSRTPSQEHVNRASRSPSLKSSSQRINDRTRFPIASGDKKELLSSEGHSALEPLQSNVLTGGHVEEQQSGQGQYQ